MKHILTLALFSFLNFIHTSCVYNKMYHFEEGDTVWIEVFSHNDSSLYESTKGYTDTMIITSIGIYDRHIPFYTHWTIPPQTYNAGAYCEYLLKSRIRNKEGYFSLTKLKKDYLKISSVLDIRYTNDFSHSSADTIPLKRYKCVIDGHIFSNCIIIDDSNSSYSEYWRDSVQNKITRYIISPQYGLLYYEFEDGEKVTRKFD